MSLETSIDNLAQAITALAQALTTQATLTAITANATLGDATNEQTANALKDVQKRTRRTKEQIAADEAAKAQPTNQSDEAEVTPVPATPEPAAEPTSDDVKAALVALRNLDNSPDRAKAILMQHSGQDKLPGVSPALFAAIIADCKKLMP